MKKALCLLVILGIVSIGWVGCEDDDSLVVADWVIGTFLTGSGKAIETTKLYKQVPGQDPVETSGTFNGGNLAGESKGFMTVTSTHDFKSEAQIVGMIESRQFELPERPTENDQVPVYVLEERQIKTGYTETRGSEITEKFDATIGLAQIFTTNINNKTHFDKETQASTYGFMGTEYVGKLNDLSQIWQDKVVGPAGYEFLTKRDAAVDDFWVSPDGNTLYHVVGSEDLSLGGKTLSTVIVELRRASNVDNLKVADRCLVEYVDERKESQTPLTVGHQNIDEHFNVLHLDPGCSGKFVHRKVGTEWWHNNILVKEEAKYYEVKINDFGYEWLEIQADGSRVRRTVKSKVTGVPSDARPFVEYSQTVREVTFVADNWETKDTKALAMPEGETNGLSGNGGIPQHPPYTSPTTPLPDGDQTTPPVDGDSVTYPDGDTEATTDGDVIPTNCAGSCDTSNDAPYCIGDYICGCNDSKWQLASCKQVCEAQSKTYNRCAYSSQYKSEFCICDEDADGDTEVIPDFCPGYEGSNQCCRTSDVCNYAENENCDCDGYCAWEYKECNSK